jgi:hypothetical protein
MNSYTASTATASLFSAGTPANAASKQPAMPASTFATQSSDQTFAMILGRILAGMTGNPAYADPQPTLAELAAARDDFVAAVNANDRGRLAIAVRDKARKRAEAVTRELALYVAQQCQGDLLTLLGSGYPARRPRGARMKIAPPTPSLRRVRQGPFSGQIVGRCERVAGALLYQWRYATVQAPTAYAITDPDSRTRVTLEDLVPGSQYLVQVRASGRRGNSDWSDPMAVFAV